MSVQQLTLANLHVVRSQKVLRIEKALARTLVKISNEIQKDQNYQNNKPNLLRESYNQLIYDNVRSALSIIQQIASRYVNDKRKTNPYPTSVDIDLIKEQTQKTVDSFWRKIQLALQNENTNLSAYVTMVATVSATGSLAKFTQSKINDLQRNPSLMGGSFADISSSEEDWSPETESPVLDIQKKPKFQWRTAVDERVCRICQGLDGQSWDSDDPSIPIPGEQAPEGTHYNCRCIINLIMPEDPQYSYL